MSRAVMTGNTTGVKAEKLGRVEIREVVPEVLLGCGAIVGNLTAERSSRRCRIRITRCGDNIADETRHKDDRFVGRIAATNA